MNRLSNLPVSQQALPENESLATRPDHVVGLLIEPLGKLGRVFGEPTVSVLLIAFGISFAGLAVLDAQLHATPEFLGLLGFAGILVLSGCAERIAIIVSSANTSPKKSGMQGLPALPPSPGGRTPTRNK